MSKAPSIVSEQCDDLGISFPAGTLQPLPHAARAIDGCSPVSPARYRIIHMAKSAVSMNPTRDDFESLLEESYADRPVSEGSVVKGKVLAIENDLVIVDV